MKRSSKIEVRILDFGIIFKSSEKTTLFAYSDKYSIDSYLEAAKFHKCEFEVFALDTVEFSDIFDDKSLNYMNTYINKFSDVKKIKEPEFILDSINVLRESQQKTIITSE